MNKPVNSSIFKTSLLAALLTSAFGVHAAGLGKLTVFSGIGQPLKAEVALTATPAELNSLTAKLASHEAFKEAGIEFMSELSGLHFELVKSPNSQPVLKLSTDRPVNEPFLHFLVELNWSAGRMLREYTFLLDPPEMLQAAKPASVVAPVKPEVESLPPRQPAGQSIPPVLAPAQSSPARPDAAKPRSTELSASEYRVKDGDFLSKIARATKPESVSLDQMLVALFNDNRDVFDSHNMNRLRAGKILRVPGADEAAKVDPVEARKLIISQAGEFNAYRRRVAAAAVVAPPADTAPKQQVSGAIKPQVEDKSPPAPKQDKLEVSRTEPAKPPAKAVAGGGLEEDLVARDKALREASERIALLEKNIENLKQLVEIKSQAGTKLQQESQAALPKPAEKPAAPAMAAKPVDSTPASAKPVEATTPATVQPPARKAVDSAPPPPEPGFVEENPQLVYGGAGLIALLLGYLGFSSWRRKKRAENAGEEMHATLSGMASREPYATVISSAANESADGGEVSIRGDFNDGGVLTAEEIVDPVAEADVLMAYGRDRQAEEILLEGLKRDPTRTAIYMKLLELHAKQENSAQFEMIANELHKLSHGRGSDWNRAVAMAQVLGLTGGVFLSAVPAVPPEEVKPAASEKVPALPAVESAVPSLPVSVEATPPPAIAEEIDSLDFDLDLGTTSAPAIVAAAAAEQAAGAVEKPDTLDFDFDLGTPSVESPVAGERQEPVATADESVDAGLDFDLDLGSPIDEAAADAPEKEATDFSRAASPEDVVDLTAGMSAAVERGAVDGMSDLKFDFDLELDSESAEMAGNVAAAVDSGMAAQTPPMTDLADIGLDVGETETTGPEVSEPSGVTRPLLENKPASGDDVDFGFDLNDLQPETVAGGEVPSPTASEVDNSEAGTKLELAHAYIEMGDLEGARELFNEVLNEGSSAQRAKAQAQLGRMGV